VIDQVRAAAGSEEDRWRRRRFVDVARPWLRFLGGLREPKDPIPFHAELEDYDTWARNERGFTPMTIRRTHGAIAHFLRWYGRLGRPLSEVLATDIDAYLVHGAGLGWCRISVQKRGPDPAGIFSLWRDAKLVRTAPRRGDPGTAGL
jgi:integrase/recombinase XerD